jgi:WD40 repeat protein
VYFDRAGRRCVKDASVGEKETSIQVGDLTQGGVMRWREVARLKDGPGRVRLSERGSHVAWAQYAQPAQVADLATGKIRAVGPAPNKDESWDIVLGPDGTTIALVSRQKFRLYDIATGKHLRDYTSPYWGRFDEKQFTPDGKALVVLSGENGWHFVPINARKPVVEVALPPGYNVKHFALFPDGKQIAVSTPKGLVRVHSLLTGKHLDSHSTYPAFVGCQMIGRDTALNWTLTGRVVVWDIRSGRVLRDFVLKVDGVKVGIAVYTFSPHGKRVAVWTKDGCTVADVASGKVIVRSPASDKLESIHFPRPGQVVGITGDRADVRYAIQLAPRRREVALSASYRRVGHAVSPDGRFVLSATHHRGKLIELATGRKRWEGHLNRPEGERFKEIECEAFFDRAGRRAIVVRDLDTTVFDVLTGKKLTILSAWHHCLLSGSGRWLGSGGSEGIWLWDLDARNAADPIYMEVPKKGIREHVLDEDAKRLITGHEDGTYLVWDMRALRARERPMSDEAIWAALGGVKMYEVLPAMEALVRGRARGVRLLAAKLSPVPHVDAGRVAALIRQLGSDDYETRVKAEAALEKVAAQAEVEMRAALAKATLEPRLRLKRLLIPLDRKDDDPAWLRQSRAVEVLERIGTPGAVAVLKKLAAGSPGAALTREARAALERLGR